MRKRNRWTLACLLAAFSVIACSGGGNTDKSKASTTPTTPPTTTPTTTTTSTTSPKYTVMVYMVGSDLESGCSKFDNSGNLICLDDDGQPILASEAPGAASTDLNEMMQVGSTDNVNVVVETGGAKQWKNSQISGASVQIWRVNSGSLELRQTLGDRNMGDAATLQDFITWAMATYPADKYALILWNHGGGTEGFGWDDNHIVGGQKDNLTIPELKQALQNAKAATGKTFDIIGFDACLMATAEVAYNMNPFGRHLVASEEIEPGHGWDYTPILDAITSNPAIDGAALGRVIADGYKAQAVAEGNKWRSQGYTYGYDKAITLSVIDLSKISSLMTTLDTFSVAANNNLLSLGSTAFITVAEGRSKSEDYGSIKSGEGTLDLTDLTNLATNLTTAYPAETNALITTLNQVVIYKVNGAARPNANGLSIYFPYKGFANGVDLTAYNSLDFSESYKAMVVRYVDIAQTDTSEPTFTNETANGSTYSAIVQGNDIDDVYAVIAVSDEYSVTILGMQSIPIESNGLVSYEWTGNWLTLNDHYISFFTIDSEGAIRLLDIPASLNGEVVDILVSLDTASGEYEILGAWPGITDGMAAKEILPIYLGDVITPLFVSINTDTGEETMVDGSAFTVSDSLYLGVSPLPSGDYDLGFLAIDLSQNIGVSNFITAQAAPKFKAKAFAAKVPQVNRNLAEMLRAKRNIR